MTNWRDKCDQPCIGDWQFCTCRQWAVSRAEQHVTMPPIIDATKEKRA